LVSEKKDAIPYGGVILDAAGNVYGTTYYGGSFVFGTVFKIDTSGSERVSTTLLARRTAPIPWAGAVILDATRDIYGVTPFGGDLSCPALSPIGCGTVFKG
jgi:uncharacterized repeat protein (TIGR03803 family)